MEYDIPYPTYIPYIGPNNAPLGVKCQGRVVTCFTTTFNIFPKVFVARRRPLRKAPSKGHHSRYITLFFDGTYSVTGFYELMRMFLVSLMHFPR